MKKMIVKVLTVLLIFGGFKIVVLEPDKPHVFKVTIPAFTDIIVFFDTVVNEAKELSESFEIEPQSE